MSDYDDNLDPEQLDWRRIRNTVIFGAILFVISWGLNWSTGSDWLPSFKAALNGILLWMLGQMQRTGHMSVNGAEVKAAFKKPAPPSDESPKGYTDMP